MEPVCASYEQQITPYTNLFKVKDSSASFKISYYLLQLYTTFFLIEDDEEPLAVEAIKDRAETN
jgi:hypothetical protein